MEWQSGNPWIKPRGIRVPCVACTREIPYDPTVANAVCSSCRHDANLPEAQGPQDLNPAHGEADRSYQFSYQAPMSPSRSLKRSADSLMDGEPPRKRASTSACGSSTNPLMRRTVVGPAAQTSQSTEVVTDDEDDDKFEDAHEELPSGLSDNYITAASDEEHKSAGMAADAEHVDEEYDESESVSSAQGVDHEGSLDIGGDAESDEELDLFNSAFGKASSHSVESEDDNEEDDCVDEADDEAPQDDDESEEESDETEQEDETKLTSINGEEKLAAEIGAYPEATDQDCVIVDEPTRISSTESTPMPRNAQSPTGPVPPDPEADLSINLRHQQNFHNKAKELIPRLPLSEHRYWIGVLNVDVKAKSINNQTQFSWMKGNRLTTVETVWNTYQTTTATDKFALLLGYERPDFEVRMEELDYFNDKKIMFRAVWEGTAGSEGRSLIQGIIPAEVVELD